MYSLHFTQFTYEIMDENQAMFYPPNHDKHSTEKEINFLLTVSIWIYYLYRAFQLHVHTYICEYYISMKFVNSFWYDMF